MKYYNVVSVVHFMRKYLYHLIIDAKNKSKLFIITIIIINRLEQS